MNKINLAFFLNLVPTYQQESTYKQLVEVLHIIRLHHRQVALGLHVHNSGLTVRCLHAETHWCSTQTYSTQRCGCGDQLASWSANRDVTSWGLKDL